MKRILAVLIAATGLAFGTQAQAVSVLGGQLYATGGSVTVEIEPGEAAYTSLVFAIESLTFGSFSFDWPSLVGTSTDTTASRTFTGFAEGEEVKIKIFVVNTLNAFYTGPGSRNPDGDIHAIVDYL